MNILKLTCYPCVHGIPRSHWKCCFGNFDFSENKSLVSLTMDFVEGEKLFWLYLQGEPGRGKTHYAVALHRALAAKNGFEGADSSVFVEWYKFLQQLKNGIGDFKKGQRYEVDDIIDSYLESDCLFLDDLNSTTSDFDQKQLEGIIISRHADSKRLVITSNEPFVSFLSRFAAHESSRIQSVCVAYSFGGKDRRNE